MRLIDADHFDHRIYNDVPLKTFGGSIKRMAAVRELIDSEPTVDAVPVVRCGDCVYRSNIDGRCRLNGGYPARECFCSYGRKEDKQR